MRIGIDVSQIAFGNTGVANYLSNLVENLVKKDRENEYVLFFSSLRASLPRAFVKKVSSNNVKIKTFKLPPALLDIMWNRLHIMPIESLIGDVDAFVSSDWSQPPSKSKKITIIYDTIIYRYPRQTHNKVNFNFKSLNLFQNIVAVQNRRMNWVKKECDKVITISQSSKKDIIDLLNIDSSKIEVIYPGA